MGIQASAAAKATAAARRQTALANQRQKVQQQLNARTAAQQSAINRQIAIANAGAALSQARYIKNHPGKFASVPISNSNGSAPSVIDPNLSGATTSATTPDYGGGGVISSPTPTSDGAALTNGPQQAGFPTYYYYIGGAVAIGAFLYFRK